MSNIDELIEEIIRTLQEELPPKYADSCKEFESLVAKDLLRASYGVLDQLRRKQDWHPSVKLQGLIDKYKVVF